MTNTELEEQNAGLRRDSEAVWRLLDAAGVPERATHNSRRVAMLISERDALRTQLAAAQARAARMEFAIRRYLDLNGDCEYVEGAPVVCPGMAENSGPCHWCELRASLAEVE